MNGLCECGCGQETKLASKTISSRGWIKGKPLRFIVGHNPSPLKTLGSHKICPKCKLDLPQTKYYKNTSQCKDCKKLDNKKKYWKNVEASRSAPKAYYQDNIEKFRERVKKRNDIPRYYQKQNLKLKYDLTLVQYDSMCNEQHSKCSICKIALELCTRTAMDHNHHTGKLRGVLCMNCNTALGHFKDSKDNLKEAIKYLEKWEYEHNC